MKFILEESIYQIHCYHTLTTESEPETGQSYNRSPLIVAKLSFFFSASKQGQILILTIWQHVAVPLPPPLT